LRSRGGAAMPVSSRNDAYGPQRNRRIEVWIRDATREREPEERRLASRRAAQPQTTASATMRLGRIPAIAAG